MGDLGFCTLSDIYKYTWDSLLSDIPADYGMPYLLIRFLHNKPLVYLFTGIKCLFQYFDTAQFTEFLPAILIIPVVYFFIKTPKKKLVYAVFLALCIFFVVDPVKWNLGVKIMLYRGLYSFISILGGSLFVRNFFKRKKIIG